MITDAPPRVIPRPSERHRIAPVHGAEQRRRSAETPVDRNRAVNGHNAAFNALGWVTGLSAAAIFGILGMTGREDTTLGIGLVPVVLVVVWVVLRQTVSASSQVAFGGVLFGGFGVRLLASVPRLVGGADSPVYQREGVRIAKSLRGLDFGVSTGRSIPGTGAVRYFSGIVNVLTGSTYIATSLVFVALAFFGQVLFLLAMRGALNTRQFRLLSLLVMFSPTLAFWPSSIGKESIALFGIGMGALGASRLYERHWNGVAPVIIGLLSVGMVRPHIAMVVLAGLLVGLFARRAHTRGRVLSHALLLGLVVVGSMWMAGASAELFDLESLDGLGDVSAALDFAQERTSQDDAQFVAARVGSVTDYPWAVVTVLFRPFPWEAPNALAMVSAIESVWLGLLLLRASMGFLTHGRELIQRGQLLFSVTYTSVFIFLFSAIGNFGILGRQRAQVIPFVLLLAAFGIAVDRSGTRPSEHT